MPVPKMVHYPLTLRWRADACTQGLVFVTNFPCKIIRIIIINRRIIACRH